VPHVDLVIVTKADLTPHPYQPSIGIHNDPPTVVTSSVTGAGLDTLCQVLAQLVAGDGTSAATSCVASTADRCRESLRLATTAISRAIDLAEANGGEELVAAELRFSLSELGKVVGTVYTDDILDRIFKSFCIGK
jgi:tRNA modification GTPase